MATLSAIGTGAILRAVGNMGTKRLMVMAEPLLLCRFFVKKFRKRVGSADGLLTFRIKIIRVIYFPP